VLQGSRPLVQQVCNLDESSCDLALGPKVCLTLRGLRNTASLLAALAGLAAALAGVALTLAVLSRQVQQGWRRQRGWEQVETSDKLRDAAV